MFFIGSKFYSNLFASTSFLRKLYDRIRTFKENKKSPISRIIGFFNGENLAHSFFSMNKF